MSTNKEYSQNMLKFYDMLNKNRVDKASTDKKHTHMSLGMPVGSYDFSGEKNHKFLDLYVKVARCGTNNIYMTEAHLPQGPILIDIDIKYKLKEESTSHLYNSQHIETLLSLYIKYIKKYLNISDDNFKIYLLEKSRPTLKEKITENDETVYVYKDGVHIVFPFICTPFNLQFIIRQQVINEMKATSLWDDILGDNELEEVIDKAIIKGPWLMYGSAKPSFEDNRYLLSGIYDDTMSFTPSSDIDIGDIIDLPKTLSIRKFTSEEELSELQAIYTWDDIKAEYETTFIGKKRSVPTAVIENEIRIAIRLTALLGQKRCNNYQPWLELGFCLHNIHDSLIDAWIDFSRTSSTKYKEGECEKMWKGFKDYGFTIRSLHRWAREDNPNGYSSFMMEELNSVMIRSLSSTSYDVAKAFHELYQYNYVCASIKNKSWYEFKNHRWMSIDEGYSIYKKLNEEFFNEYMKMGQVFNNKAMTTQSEDDKTRYLDNQTKAMQLGLKLRDSNYKKKIMEELIKLYYDENFINEVDEKRNLLCFNNGVYDLENNLFREGRPEDYITLCTKNDYKPYDAKNDYIKKVEAFMTDILPDVDVKNYTLDLMASCLQGHIPDEKFHIWTGTGGNGKSLSINLLQQALGEYACTLPIAMLTGKRATATSANPELAKTKGKRFAVFQEPEKGDKIHVGHMKELTSNNDKISARTLFKEPVEFFPQFKLLLTCNDKPEIDANDGGTWRRLRVVPFEMKFVDDPKEPHERKINRKIKEELPYWKDALMSILIKRFQNYKINGLTEPSKVTSFTSEYQKDSDVYLEFINYYIVKSENANDSIDTSQLYFVFKQWLKEAHSNKKVVSRKEFIKLLSEKLGPVHDDFVPGYKMIERIGRTHTEFVEADDNGLDS